MRHLSTTSSLTRGIRGLARRGLLLATAGATVVALAGCTNSANDAPTTVTPGATTRARRPGVPSRSR